MPSFQFETPTNSSLEQARAHVRAGHMADAEAAYQSILVTDALNIEALRFVANAALARHDPATAVMRLSQAAEIERDNIGVLLDLGAAYLAGDRRDEARHVLRHALEISSGLNTTARLMFANILEQDQRSDVALVHYFRAILDAQAAGKWLSDATTEPGLQRMVRHAMEFVARGRRALFDSALAPFHGVDISRIDAALQGYLLENQVMRADPRQRTSFFYVPDLTTKPIIDPARIEGLREWAATAEFASTSLGHLVNRSRADTDTAAFSLAALSATTPAETPNAQRTNIILRGNISALARKQMPALLSSIKLLPLMRVSGYGENVSVLKLPPKAHLPVAYAASNAICRAVVGLPDSSTATLVVGGEYHELPASGALICDASFGLGFENRSNDEVQLVCMDAWHPDLSHVEIQALSAFIRAALSFDSKLQNPDEATA